MRTLSKPLGVNSSIAGRLVFSKAQTPWLLLFVLHRTPLLTMQKAEIGHTKSGGLVSAHRSILAVHVNAKSKLDCKDLQIPKSSFELFRPPFLKGVLRGLDIVNMCTMD